MFNRAKLVGETLQSVLSQTYPPHEIIVVDDGSTDGSAEVAEAFHPSVRVVRQTNQGAGAARNRGFAEATGDVIHFMDSDDLTSPNTYQTQLTAMNATTADMAYGPWIKTTFQERRIRLAPVALQQRALPAIPRMDRWVMRGWVTTFQPCLLRRSLVEKMGSYRVDLKPSEDSEFLFRIGKSGATLVHTPETLMLYRVHPEGQISVANEQQRAIDWAKFLVAVDEQVENRDELDALTRFEFDLQRIAASAALNGPSETLSLESASRIRWQTRAIEPAVRLARRFVSKFRTARFGGNYGAPFQVGPPTLFQRQLISRMGYSIDD